MAVVEIRVSDKKALPERMSAMREWLDHPRFEPATFRYTAAVSCVLCRVEFEVESEAKAFAVAFGGRVSVAAFTDGRAG